MPISSHTRVAAQTDALDHICFGGAAQLAKGEHACFAKDVCGWACRL